MDQELVSEFLKYLRQRESIVAANITESKGTDLFKIHKGAQLELMEIMCTFEELINR